MAANVLLTEESPSNEPIPATGIPVQNEDIENPRQRRLSSSSFQVATDNLNDIVGGFFRGFGIARHVVADVVFHQFGHEAVDGAAGGSEALEGVGAGLILMERAKNAFELPDDFLGAIDQIQLFSRSM
jgi:hypothetical protein